MKSILLNLFAIISLTTMAQNSIHEMEFETIDGSKMSFADFKGKKILIFNAASKCGYTGQYEGLQELHDKYGDQVAIIGFPANNFGKQEPGSNDEIATFCKKNYGVTFTMAAKVSVKGDDIHPLFSWLIEQENSDFTGNIKWNFEKFLLDENGKLIHRYRSGTKPMSSDITTAITQ